MTNADPNAPSGEQCPHCGSALVTGTTDLARTPDETTEVDRPRAELVPGQMAQSSLCPTPGCPGPETGAQL